MTKEIFLIGFLVIGLLLSSVKPGLACTSYVVYSNEIIYGMNFDWGFTDCRFSVEEAADIKYFVVRFKLNFRLASLAAMNSKGFFANYQVLPGNRYRKKWRLKTISQGQLWRKAIAEKSSINELKELIGDKIVTPIPDIALHNMYADLHGDAVILEILEEKQNLIENEKNFLVMTNFFNSDFVGLDYQEVSGFGGDRYQIVYEEILKNMGSFDLDTAFDILKKAKQYTTRASMVFFPEELIVYLALERNFQQIWKIDILAQTIETYRGFKEYKQLSIAGSGLTSTELLKWARDN